MLIRERLKLWAFIAAAIIVAVAAANLRGDGGAERLELLWGTPTPVEAFHPSYVRGHCGHSTTWVIEYLTAESLAGNAERGTFKADNDVPVEWRATLSDYRGSGFDRGHLAPADDAGHSRRAMRETFLLSNAMPQRAGLNRGQWRELEEHLQRVVEAGGVEAWVVTLPLFLPDENGVLTIQTIGESHIRVPTHCAKAVLFRRGDKLEMRGWLLPNVDEPPAFAECETSVDAIERTAGMDVFAALSDELENRLESRSFTGCALP